MLAGRATTEELLLDKGADVNLLDSHEVSSLILASKHGHSSLVELLLERGAEVARVMPAFRLAICRHGHHEVVKVLLGAGAEVDRIDNEGWFALTAASKRGHHEVRS